MSRLRFLDAHRLETVHGDFRAHVFRNLARGEPALAVTCGDLGGSAPLLARVHSSCVTSETYGGCDCDCAEQLDASLARIARAGRGALFYLIQEGRGAGFAAKARDRMLVQASGNRLTTFDAYDRMGLPHDQRTYDEVSAMCERLGVSAPLLLLTNNPEKTATLTAAGVAIAATAPLAPPPSPFSRHYLAAKARSGHRLAGGENGPEIAPLPERVEVLTPAPLPASHFLRVASYLLPVRLAAPAWFRVHVYLDATGGERVVLSHGAVDDGPPPLVRLQRDTLRERFPLRAPVLHRQWLEAAGRIVAHGRGAVLFGAARGFDLAAAEEVDAEGAALLAAHVGAGGGHPRAHLLHDPGDPDGAALAAALARRGVALGAGS